MPASSNRSATVHLRAGWAARRSARVTLGPPPVQRLELIECLPNTHLSAPFHQEPVELDKLGGLRTIHPRIDQRVHARVGEDTFEQSISSIIYEFGVSKYDDLRFAPRRRSEKGEHVVYHS